MLMIRVWAQVQATNRRFNVTAPIPDSPYVAGQIVPVTYTLPDDANLPSVLGLAVYFTTRDPSLPFVQATISDNADLSQGFSFRHTTNTEVYYEHQLNYGIPKETKAGNYQIVFVDTKGGGNTSIPIVVRPYSSNPSASSTNKPQVSNIFLQGNSASSTSHFVVYNPLGFFLMFIFYTFSF
ncbi:uncharacterized protein BX664DRAFT_347871 [Halteromyces radiatus]|uniref:uncharacterized protein n=1 Tax=Halteromyces radiatus TaxID=101107 RepID=UPI00221FB77B|nr:uncharacterized protein BX664DRAFT_347871 [Halteromyces radiatus]KAI8092595.1 hypothetical protein BX664DRAFT_347871 [Halteromyces radiatus]